MIDVSPEEARFIAKIERIFDIPVLVTGGVAVAFWCGPRPSRDLDLVVPAFWKPGLWADLLLMPRPQRRRVDLDLVRRRHDRKYGEGYCEIVSAAIRDSQRVETHGEVLRIAPKEYLLHIKKVYRRMRDKESDLADIRLLEAVK